MNVEVPYVFPFENVPVTKGAGKLFVSTTAGSTPGGVRATLVSARGRFIHDWRKATLVSLTFQAPPDTVQRANLLLPQFMPFEAVTIEGLGGAAAGGTEAAGKTLGLEGALIVRKG